ncbi:PilZ domain-containing protein, partial [Kaarinaea lacus]
MQNPIADTTHNEHRWSDRRQVDYPVKIYRNGQHLTNSAIADISLEGIFIDMRGQRMNPNTYIEVEFNLANKEESIPYRLPALIRHCSENGIGAMFLHFSTGTFRHFHRILYKEPGIRPNSKRLKARWSPRKNININLSLYQNGEKIADASTSNLSFEGVFIKTDLSLPLYSSLTVEFSLSDDEPEQILQVPCLVRHR